MMKALLVIISLSSFGASAWGHFEQKARLEARYTKMIVATKKALSRHTVSVVDTCPKCGLQPAQEKIIYRKSKIDTTIVLGSDSFRITGRGKNVSLAYYCVKDSITQGGHIRGSKLPFKNSNQNVQFKNEGNMLDLQYAVPEEEILIK